MKLAFVFFSMILVNNFVFVKLLGVSPFIGGSKNSKTILGTSAALTAVLVVSAAIVWPIYVFVLLPLGLVFLETLLFVLIVVFVSGGLALLLKQFLPKLQDKIGSYLPAITTNSVILGYLLLSVQSQSVGNPALGHYSFIETIVAALGVGVGFALAVFLFSGVQRRLLLAKPPKVFAGLPITLVSAAIVSIAFMGFGGVLEKIFL